MKRTVERIVPLVPAAAAVGASLCASSLLFTTPPQPVGPRPVATPVTGQVGRVVATPVPLTQPASRRAAPVVRPRGLHALGAQARRAETPAPPPSHHPTRKGSPVGDSKTPPPSTGPPPAPAPSPSPAPVSVPQVSTNQAPPAKGGSRPGWGHGDQNHDHTGPPGKRSKGQDAQTAPQPPPAAQPTEAPQPTPGNSQGDAHSGGKKSPGR
jgi:hypothetical protein